MKPEKQFFTFYISKELGRVVPVYAEDDRKAYEIVMNAVNNGTFDLKIEDTVSFKVQPEYLFEERYRHLRHVLMGEDFRPLGATDEEYQAILKEANEMMAWVEKKLLLEQMKAEQEEAKLEATEQEDK